MSSCPDILRNFGDPPSYTEAKACVDEVLGKGIFIPGASDVSQEIFRDQEIVRQFCLFNDSANAPICRDTLIRMCKFTSEQTLNMDLMQLCGCYLPDSEYTNTGGRVCDNLCVGATVIKYVEEGQTVPSRCSSGVCVIDGVSINISSSFGGDINFYQTCPSCGPTPCRCIINDIDVLVDNVKSSNLNIEQNCKGGTTCYVSGENGQQQEVPCESYLAVLNKNTQVGNFSAQGGQSSANWGIFWLSFSFGVLFFLLFIYLVYEKLNEKPKIVVQRYQYGKKPIPVSEAIPIDLAQISIKSD